MDKKTKKAILFLAIEKAMAGGYDWDKYHSPGVSGKAGWVDYAIMVGDYPTLIYNHDFAKALWGDDPSWAINPEEHVENWQHHLQQMVIADDPLEYLGNNI